MRLETEMVEEDELRALAAGTPLAPSRVATLDVDCEEQGLQVPALALQEARDAGCRVTLRLCGFLNGTEAAERIAALDDCLVRDGWRLAPDALAISAGVASPAELALCAVGACPRPVQVYLLLPQLALEAIQRGRGLTLAGGMETPARRWWEGLVALAAEAPGVSLVPEVPGPGVSVLAPGQRWLGPAPGSGELIPAAPRRLRLTVDFGALLADCGEHPVALGRRAGRIVAAADRALSGLLGPGGPRRLALELDGITRALLARGHDPRRFATLSWLRSRLGAFRDGARAASVRLARVRGDGGGLAPFALPGVLEVAVAGPLDRALLAHGARHSHLVCLSPWSLAPPELGRDGLGLLPALACADSIAWRRPQAECPAQLYSETLRFAWAVALRN
jgi:hypothetical protein